MLEAKLIIEPVPDDEVLESLLVTGEERRAAEKFGTRRRKAEYLMWRHIVRRETGADTQIGYNGLGAPVLKNRTEYIGVSHCADSVAVVVSPRPCAVDIERTDRDFSKIASRFVSRSESGLSDDPRLLCALWCAKETLYKYSGKRGLDFLRDICVEKVDFSLGIVAGSICGGEPVTMKLTSSGESLVVWVG